MQLPNGLGLTIGHGQPCPIAYPDRAKRERNAVCERTFWRSTTLTNVE
jgi:hypothetical protein